VVVVVVGSRMVVVVVVGSRMVVVDYLRCFFFPSDGRLPPPLGLLVLFRCCHRCLFSVTGIDMRRAMFHGVDLFFVPASTLAIRKEFISCDVRMQGFRRLLVLVLMLMLVLVRSRDISTISISTSTSTSTPPSTTPGDGSTPRAVAVGTAVSNTTTTTSSTSTNTSTNTIPISLHFCQRPGRQPLRDPVRLLVAAMPMVVLVLMRVAHDALAGNVRHRNRW
jgi:hypothetical protein